MQADKRRKREIPVRISSSKTKEGEDEGFQKIIARRKGSQRKQVCWQQVWGRDWVKSAENKADDVGEARFYVDDSAASSHIKWDFLIIFSIIIIIGSKLVYLHFHDILNYLITPYIYTHSTIIQ